MNCPCCGSSHIIHFIGGFKCITCGYIQYTKEETEWKIQLHLSLNIT